MPEIGLPLQTSGIVPNGKPLGLGVSHPVNLPESKSPLKTLDSGLHGRQPSGKPGLAIASSVVLPQRGVKLVNACGCFEDRGKFLYLSIFG